MIIENQTKKILEATRRDLDDNDYLVRVCGLIELTDKVENSITHQKIYTLTYHDDVSGTVYDINANFSDFGVKRLETFLCDNGIEVVSEFIKELSGYLQNKASNLKINAKYVERIGFNDEKQEFYLNNLITRNSISPLKQGLAHKEQLGPKGDLDAYDDMLKTCVRNPEMQLAFVLGFTAPLVAYIDDKLDLGVILVGMSGNSSSGKTTASQLMVSTFANPKLQTNYGFAIKAKSTRLNFNVLLEDIWGLPVLIDDISALYRGDLQDLIYDLESGTMKGRSNLEYTSSNASTWKGLINLTSEKGFLNSTMLGGATARLLNFKNVQWTISAEQAEKIKSVTSENYGFYGTKFVKRLILDKTPEQHIEKIQDIIKEFKARLNYVYYDEITERILKKYCTIIYASRLVRDYMSLTMRIHTDEIFDILVKVEQEAYKERELVRCAYKDFVQFVHDNMNIFDDSSEFGMIVDSEKYKTIYITDAGFNKFLSEYQYLNREHDIISGWINDGYLIKDRDNAHNMVRKTINKKVVRCYKILI